MTTDASPRQALLDRLDASRDRIVETLGAFIRVRSVNPPGDTREAADFVRALLRPHGIEAEEISARPDMPNLLASVEGARPGRHLVLNGHLDVFPVETERMWSGALEDGRVIGRGASDMKTGTLASILAFTHLHALRDLWGGRLTLAVVSDEQSGGFHGTRHLFETVPDRVRGDCCLNGEPSGVRNVRFMEKGTLRFAARADGPGGHGGYPHRARNPIEMVSRFTTALYGRFHLRPVEMPEAVSRVLAQEATRIAADADLGEGANDIARRITVNVGMFQGGLKATRIPTACEACYDIRVPTDAARDEVRAALPALAEEAGVTIEFDERHSYAACMTDPAGEMLGLLQDNVEALSGTRPAPVVSLGGTDTRYWRWAGIPAVVYGPSPASMGGEAEEVTVEELMLVVKAHALSAFDYLSR